MPDLLTIKTPHFDLTVWAKEVERPQKLLAKTHAARNIVVQPCSLRFSPALIVLDMVPAGTPAEIPVTQLPLYDAIFFENKQYEFDFLFSSRITQAGEPKIVHRLTGIEESFHYKSGSLRGGINFGNDIGWFRLGVSFILDGKQVEQYISFEVLPTKMVMATDLQQIYKDIDALYPLWRYSFAQKTEQQLAKSRQPHERFDLLWLAHFEHLRKDMEEGVKLICRAPHSRLLPYTHAVRADRLRGRLPSKLEERVTTHIQNGEHHHRYQISSKRLSFDTPENQFIKMVLIRCSQDITRFIERARAGNQAPDRERLSASFFNELERWKTPLDQLLNRPFFAEVGKFEGIEAESLVLHQRAGYAGVYRIWQELKLYLDLFGDDASISMKSVAELYEVWCLLEVRRILIGELGFEEKRSNKAVLKNAGMEKSLHEGFNAAFHLERADGIKIRLAHEPVFLSPANNKLNFNKIYSWNNTQKPDILLEATFENGEKIHWIFDAKYRIAEDKNGVDCAPEDAINQMHRYRDALIHIHEANDGGHEKSRPVLGAYVLYPGSFDEVQSVNSYEDAIEAVGIGAFPLLPGKSNQWLKNFLVTCFGWLKYENYVSTQLTYFIPHPDRIFAEDAVRISQTGTQLARYADLTLVASLGYNRSDAYIEQYRTGSARWYHIPLSTTNKVSVERNAMREVRYCAIAHGDADGRHITHLYQVKSVKLKNRNELAFEQTGRDEREQNTKYWLFELDYARPLLHPLNFPLSPGFIFRLINAADLLATKKWEALPGHYAMMQ
ncbi:MAG: restriction endonuclease-like protein [Nitrosomonadales bacterium]